MSIGGHELTTHYVINCDDVINIDYVTWPKVVTIPTVYLIEHADWWREGRRWRGGGSSESGHWFTTATLRYGRGKTVVRENFRVGVFLKIVPRILNVHLNFPWKICRIDSLTIIAWKYRNNIHGALRARKVTKAIALLFLGNDSKAMICRDRESLNAIIFRKILAALTTDLPSSIRIVYVEIFDLTRGPIVCVNSVRTNLLK